MTSSVIRIHVGTKLRSTNLRPHLSAGKYLYHNGAARLIKGGSSSSKAINCHLSTISSTNGDLSKRWISMFPLGSCLVVTTAFASFLMMQSDCTSNRKVGANPVIESAESARFGMELKKELLIPMMASSSRSRLPPPQWGSSVPSLHYTTSQHRHYNAVAITSFARDDEFLDKNGILDGSREDCPLCRKYSQGPCGEIFKKWLACTDTYNGMTNDNQPLHLTKCSNLAETLATCLDSNLSYYEQYSEFEREESLQEEKEKQIAWQEFIHTLKNDYNILTKISKNKSLLHNNNNNNNNPRNYNKNSKSKNMNSRANDQKLDKKDITVLDISSSKKESVQIRGQEWTVLPLFDITMQVRWQSQSGIVQLENKSEDGINHDYSTASLLSSSNETKKLTLLCVYVEDEHSNLLGAASSQDLETSEYKILRFQLQPNSEIITAFALYEEENSRNDDHLTIICKTQQLPPRPIQE